MKWFKATRATGEKGGNGEFIVEDSNGLDWQVTVIESKKNPGKLVCSRPAVCHNGLYECGAELEMDIFDAVKTKIEEEEQ